MTDRLSKVLNELVINIQGGELTSYSKEMIEDARLAIIELVAKERQLLIRPGKPKNSRYNKEIMGWNVHREETLKNMNMEVKV